MYYVADIKYILYVYAYLDKSLNLDVGIKKSPHTIVRAYHFTYTRFQRESHPRLRRDRPIFYY